MSEPKGPRDPDAEPQDGHPSPASGEESHEPTSPEGEEKPSTPLTQQIGRIVVLLLLVLFVVFALDNAQRVNFSWVFGETRVHEDVTGATTGGIPLIVLLLASFAIGAAVGALGVWQTGRARRRADDKERLDS